MAARGEGGGRLGKMGEGEREKEREREIQASSYGLTADRRD